MERLKSISQKEYNQGYFIQLECCMCMHQETVAASTKNELKDILNEKGWKEINSDEYQVTGYYCGCDYRD